MTHLVQMFIDPRLTARWLAAKDLNRADLGYGVHSLLRAAFGEQGPQPFRTLERDNGLEVLGYSNVNAGALKQTMNEAAEPMVSACFDHEMLFSKSLPEWREGASFSFDIRVCPVSRSNRALDENGQLVPTEKVREKDLFLARLDQVQRETGEKPTLSRYTEYQDWLQEQLAPAARLISANVTSFSLQKVQRRRKDRTLGTITRPDVTFSGRLAINDPQGFAALIRRGIGRHAAFGFGMLLLRPDKGA